MIIGCPGIPLIRHSRKSADMTQRCKFLEPGILFNHPVGEIHNRVGDAKTKSRSRSKIEGKFKNDRLFDRKIGWVRPLAYLVDVDSRLAI